jgi:hypothetical protein
MNSSSYTVIPANKQCVAATTVTVTSLPGTNTSTTNNEVDALLSQIAYNASYDNTSAKIVTSLYGGSEEKNKLKFKIVLKKKETIIYADDDIEALMTFMQNKSFKKDNIIYVNNSVYILRAHSKNKFFKIN